MSSRERANPDANTDVQVALRNVEIEAVNFAYRFVKDGRVREDYVSKAKALRVQIMPATYNPAVVSAQPSSPSAAQMCIRVYVHTRCSRPRVRTKRISSGLAPSACGAEQSLHLRGEIILNTGSEWAHVATDAQLVALWPTVWLRHLQPNQRLLGSDSI